MMGRRGIGAGVALAFWIAGRTQGAEGMTVSSGFVTAEDGVRLHFEQVGNGPRVVLIPNGLYLMDDFASLAAGRTLAFYDLRNRGHSDSGDAARLARGIAQDVDDLDAVRRHFGAGRADLIGHSYVALIVLRYAMEHSEQVGRAVAIGAPPPDPKKSYPAQDEVLSQVMAELGALQTQRASFDQTDFCRKTWSVLRRLYVVDPRDADKIRWDRCELPKERGFMKYFIENVMPSIQAFKPTKEDFARVDAPVLVVHGRQDRSSPYGGATEWAARLKNGRLLAVANAAHAPWIEAPETLVSIRTFLDDAWPETAENVRVPD
jgi:pimeloyl-ACP methyl ester carboxylesterase